MICAVGPRSLDAKTTARIVNNDFQTPDESVMHATTMPPGPADGGTMTPGPVDGGTMTPSPADGYSTSVQIDTILVPLTHTMPQQVKFIVPRHTGNTHVPPADTALLVTSASLPHLPHLWAQRVLSSIMHDPCSVCTASF
ncbi:hypothetical protein PTKIN_Ptkin06aG0119200 [Pterospermum kingtungense]